MKNKLQVKLGNGITITAEEATNPDYPGIWIVVKSKKIEVAAALVESDDGKIKGRLWDYNNYENDPISLNLFDPETEEVCNG